MVAGYLRLMRDAPTPYATDRERRLEAVLRELERRFGPWVVYRLRDARPVVGERVIATGALSLDLATGVGGVPRGRVTELIGPVSSGKSSLAFNLLANAQRGGGFVTYIDTNHQADFEQMGRCGMDLSDLFLTVPESAQEGLEIATLLVESGGLDALVVDSPLAPALSPRGLARVNAALRDSPTAVVFVTEAGSRSGHSLSLRHFASLRLALTPLRPLMHASGEVLGLRVRVDVLKNKLAAPHGRAELDLRRDRGIHREADLLDLGLTTAVLREEPSGLCFGDRVLGRGRARAVMALGSDPILAAELEGSIRRALGA